VFKQPVTVPVLLKQDRSPVGGNGQLPHATLASHTLLPGTIGCSEKFLEQGFLPAGIDGDSRASRVTTAPERDGTGGDGQQQRRPRDK